jgi:L-ribulose-5-phosphate 3-epimerase
MSAIVPSQSTSTRQRPAAPYATSLAWQGYLPVGQGILDAGRQGFEQVYLDLSSSEDAPETWSAEKVDRVNGLQEQYGVRLIGHSNYRLPLASDIPEVAKGALARLIAEIDVCGELSAPLVCHGGPGAETRYPREAKQRGLEALQKTLGQAQLYAQDQGVQLILENLANHNKHPFIYFATTAQEIQQQLDAVPGLLALLDVGHANVNGGDPVSMLGQLAGRVWGMSLSNNGGAHDSHSPLDKGTINFVALRGTIELLGWRGVVAFETRGADLAANLRFLESLETRHRERLSTQA